MEQKRIYKKSMAEFLVDHGCHLLQTTQDVLQPERLNWLFEDNETLREQMTEFTKGLKSMRG